MYFDDDQWDERVVAVNSGQKLLELLFGLVLLVVIEVCGVRLPYSGCIPHG